MTGTKIYQALYNTSCDGSGRFDTLGYFSTLELAVENVQGKGSWPELEEVYEWPLDEPKKGPVRVWRGRKK